MIKYAFLIFITFAFHKASRKAMIRLNSYYCNLKFLSQKRLEQLFMDITAPGDKSLNSIQICINVHLLFGQAY